MILSLRDEGLGYKKIALHLNKSDIKTMQGKSWCGGGVFMFIKRHRQREKRESLRNQKYKDIWSDMRIEWKKN